MHGWNLDETRCRIRWRRNDFRHLPETPIGGPLREPEKLSAEREAARNTVFGLSKKKSL
jgi:hypothetical protein